MKMLINFNKRASPNHNHLNAEKTNSIDSSQIFTNQFNNSGETVTENETNTKNDDVIVIEEAKEDCVYQVTIKKVYNKHLIDDNNNDLNNNNNNDKLKLLYGTYKPLGSSFFSYINASDSNALDQTLSNAFINNNNNNNNNNATKDGLVYTRVKIRQLKYATLPKLIEHLTNQETGQLDSSLVQIFLVTYRTFTDTSTAIKMIRQRYEKIVPASLEMTEDVRLEHLKSFRSIIYMWLEYYSEDFIDPPEFTNLNELNRFALKHFTSTNNSSSSPELLQVIQSKFELFQQIANNNSKTNSPLSLSPPSSRSGPNIPIPQKSKSCHRRSCSNLGPLSSSSSIISDSNNSLTNFSTGNIIYLGSSNSGSLSKSQINLTGNKPPSPIFNLFKKSNSNAYIEASNNLMEANFMSIDSVYFAEQLTYIDKCLFQKICAHLCLGGVWSTRYQKNKNDLTKSSNTMPILSDKFASIGAFIDQFNIVSFIVQATVLENTELKSTERAKIIRKWIEIAQACRNYKNFSSLNAIIQGLNTQCVSRLEKTWNEITSDYKAQFQELTEMFSEDQNQKIFRRILLKDLDKYSRIYENNIISFNNEYINNNNNNSSPKSLNKNLSDLNLNSPFNYLEGTAKYADINSGINATLGRKYKETMKKQIKKQEPLGTIPFLGTFLKDLEYINAQNPSKMDKGLINVLQKRKEFEIIAQIKLLQQASQLYNITPNPDFNVWLHKQTVYSEEQNYKFSNIIEPLRNDVDMFKFKINSASRSGSVDSLNSNKTSSTNSKHNQTHSRNNSNSGVISDSNEHPWNKNSFSNNLNGDSSSTSNTSNNIEVKQTLKSTSSNLVVRVNIESTGNQNTVLYKTICVKDSDRTKDVKRSILDKFMQNPDTCDKYTLVQVFNNNSTELNSNNMQQKELTINDNCNVFYAAKSVPNMQFVLRQKGSNNNNYNNQNGSISSGNGSFLNSDSNISSLNNINNKSFASPMISRTNKLTKNLIPNGSRSTSSNNNNNKLMNDLPPQSPNHHQNKSNSWNKIYKKMNF